jgi:predicted nucleotidyltransferase component of viral defense system
MKNATQLKALVKNIAKDKGISAQIIMQNYMLERLLERISLSKYQSNFILKGGFLIAAIVGLDTRATMDLDATIRGIPVNHDAILQIFTEICDIQVNDDITFKLKHVVAIRESEAYNGVRVAFEGIYPPMAVPLKIDITTGDKITPKEILYEFQLLFEPRKINVLAYNLETILAEKLETIISRGDQNTRSRDFYDVYILYKLQWQNVDINTLKSALYVTAKNRKSDHIIPRHKEVLEIIIKSEVMNNHWKSYQKDFDYAKDIALIDICHTVENIMSIIISDK